MHPHTHRPARALAWSLLSAAAFLAHAQTDTPVTPAAATPSDSSASSATAATPTAAAGGAPTTDHFAVHMASAETNKALRDLGSKWDKQLGIACDQPYTVDPASYKLTVLEPVLTPERGKPPVAGAWQYQFTVQRCGHSKVYNALVLPKTSGDPRYIGMLPGQTLVDATLLRDVLATLRTGIQADAKAKQGKTCTDFAVTDTRVVTAPAEGQAPSRFEEAWTVRYCGEERSLPMCFTPGPQSGTRYVAMTCDKADQVDAKKAAPVQPAAQPAVASPAASPASDAKR